MVIISQNFEFGIIFEKSNNYRIGNWKCLFVGGIQWFIGRQF